MKTEQENIEIFLAFSVCIGILRKQHRFNAHLNG